jgi:glycosyltransferase involved in cell wall biosynthesis
MALRILHLICGGEIGGAEQNVLNLLVNMDKKTISPYLGCLVKNSPFAVYAGSYGIDTRIFAMRFPIDILPVIPLVRFCRDSKIDLIHCHGARATLLGRITSAILSIPNITTVHSLPEFDYACAWKGRLASLLERETLPWSSGMITVSDSLREWVKGKIKETSFPVKTIYNGCPRYNFTERQAMRADFRRQWGIPPHKKVIGTIGRLPPVKGQIHLAEAEKFSSGNRRICTYCL